MNTNKKEKFINKNNAVHKRFWQIGIRTFFVFLFVIAFIGLLLPLRPKESELEKRELSKFPKPTISTVLNGEFFSDISTWYADTFPFRETLMSANAKMKNSMVLRHRKSMVMLHRVMKFLTRMPRWKPPRRQHRKKMTFRKKMEPSMPSLKDWEKSISLITEVSNFTASAGPGQTLTST